MSRTAAEQIIYASGASEAEDTERAEMRLSVLDFSSPDQVQHFKDVEAAFKKMYPVYSRLRMQPTTYQNDPAAIWEFTFGGRARMFRAADLGFGRVGGKEYAIYVSAPLADWTKYEKVFSVVRDGFRRTDPKS